MFKKLKNIGNSLNGVSNFQIPFERGRKAVKWKNKSCPRHGFSPTILERKIPQISRPLTIFPKPFVAMNRKPAIFLNYPQLPKVLLDPEPNYLKLLHSRTLITSRGKNLSQKRPSTPGKTNFVHKKLYSNFSPNSQEQKKNVTKEDSYFKAIKNNIQTLLEKQINELQTKRVRKNINSVVNLQKMVVDKIREGNKYDTRPQEKAEVSDTCYSAKKNSTHIRNILERRGSCSKPPETNSSLVPMSQEQKPQPQILNNFKSKYSKKISHDKIDFNHPQAEGNLESWYQKISKTPSTKNSKAFQPVKDIQNGNNIHKLFSCQQEINKQENEVFHKSTKEILMAHRGKSDKTFQDLKHQSQFPNNISNISELKKDMRHLQGINVKENHEGNLIKLHNAFIGEKNKSDHLPCCKVQEKTTPSTKKTLEYIVNKHEKYMPMPIGENKDIYKPRDKKSRPLPNYVRDHRVKESQLEFSHKAVYLRDGELYKNFRNIERDRQLRSIYNAHWGEKIPRRWDFEQANVANNTFNAVSRKKHIITPQPVVVHKLNPSSIAEKIKLRAKIINKNKIKDEFLQPQVYCRKSIAMGLAQLPIMPCKNVIRRNDNVNITNKNKSTFLRTKPQKPFKGNKLYAQCLKKSRPLWGSQKMITSREVHPSHRKKIALPKKRKMDFKGALKYIMNFKSRLQQQ